MPQKKISSGVVHIVPEDFKCALTADPQALTAWRILHRSRATSGLRVTRQSGGFEGSR